MVVYSSALEPVFTGECGYKVQPPQYMHFPYCSLEEQYRKLRA